MGDDGQNWGMPPGRVAGLGRVEAAHPVAVADPHALWTQWYRLGGQTMALFFESMVRQARTMGDLAMMMRGQIKQHTGVDIGAGADACVRYADEQLVEYFLRDRRANETPAKAVYRQLKQIMNRHHHTRATVQAFMKQLPSPVQVWAEMQQAFHEHMGDVFEEHFAADHFRRIGNLLEGEGALYHPDYNGQFLAENAQGKIVAIDAEAVARQFAAGAPRPLPRVIITSSHAQGESIEDVTMILHGIEAMARDVGKPLTLAKANAPIEAGQTLVMMSCHTERNPLLNAAQLGYRLNELRGGRRGMRDSFQQMAPGAKQIARFVLRCMAADQERVNLHDARPLAAQMAGANQPLVLQSDALAILQHSLLLWGYSKGGNVVSCAARELVHMIEAKDRDGRPLVVLDASRGADDPAEIRAKQELISSLRLIVVAAREVELSRALKHAGLRRFAFNNLNDPVLNDHDYNGSPGDVKIRMRGPAGPDGHRPDLAMGTREKSGFFITDERIRKICTQAFDFDLARMNPDLGRVH